jgi:hypothetical protein
MPRSTLDQALITGISTSLNYALAALIQDSIKALGLRGPAGPTPAKVDRHTWRRASIGSTWPPSAPGWPHSARCGRAG